MKRPNHRPSEYADLESFSEKTEEYLAKGTELSVNGWAAFLGISRMTLSNYKRRGAGWAETIANAIEQIHSERIANASER